MKRSFLIFIAIALSSLYCSTDDAQIYIEGKVTVAQSGDPVPLARVELRKMGESSSGFFTYNTELVISTNTDSLGNYKIQEDVEDCRGLKIHAYKDGFYQIGLYDPKCTLGNKWQRIDIILDRDE